MVSTTLLIGPGSAKKDPVPPFTVSTVVGPFPPVELRALRALAPSAPSELRFPRSPVDRSPFTRSTKKPPLYQSAQKVANHPVHLLDILGLSAWNPNHHIGELSRLSAIGAG